MGKYLAALPVMLFPYSLLAAIACLYSPQIMETVFRQQRLSFIAFRFGFRTARLAVCTGTCNLPAAEKRDRPADRQTRDDRKTRADTRICGHIHTWSRVLSDYIRHRICRFFLYCRLHNHSHDGSDRYRRLRTGILDGTASPQTRNPVRPLAIRVRRRHCGGNRAILHPAYDGKTSRRLNREKRTAEKNPRNSPRRLSPLGTAS